jgi:DNA-binding PadR family transcriptional regulator
MALRDPEIPNHRERSSLQLMKYGNNQSDLYPTGKGTIANLVKKGWIEQGVNPGGARQFRITSAGRTALAARIREADRHRLAATSSVKPAAPPRGGGQ